MSLLEDLADLVRRAEEVVHGDLLGKEREGAEEELGRAESHLAEVTERNRELRKAAQDELGQIAREEESLGDLVRRAATLKKVVDTEQVSQIEVLVEKTREDLKVRRELALGAIEELEREGHDAYRAAKEALARYERVLEEHRLRDLKVDERGANRRLDKVRSLFPSEQVVRLERDIDEAPLHFPHMNPREQKARVKIWIGKLRQLQEWPDSEGVFSTGDMTRLSRIFPKLVGVSKAYRPGYIEAFRETYSADWEAYIREAEEELVAARVLAVREAKLRETKEVVVMEHQAKGREALDELKMFLSGSSPEEAEGTAAVFHELVGKVISGLGAGDPELLELVAPYEEHLSGKEFRALRRHLERGREGREASLMEYKGRVLDVVPFTRGVRAVMVGGSQRPEQRKTLLKVFEFGELEWVETTNNKNGKVDGVLSRIKSRNVELVMALRFNSHTVSDDLKDACDRNDVPYLFLDSYSPVQVAEILRRDLIGRPVPSGRV